MPKRERRLSKRQVQQQRWVRTQGDFQALGDTVRRRNAAVREADAFLTRREPWDEIKPS